VQIDTDTDRCIGAGQCVLTAPELFDQNDRGTVVVLDAHPEGRQRKVTDEAAAACPSAAIRLIGRPDRK
jgi:ferredoxin